MHQPMTLKQMMDSSIVFKVCFWGDILAIILVGIVSILVNTVNCNTPHSCSYWYSFYTIQCSKNGNDYCCSPSSSYCGDYNCFSKPIDYFQPCVGFILLTWIGSALVVFLTVAVFIMFCNFRNRARNPLFNPGAQAPPPHIYQYPVSQQQQQIIYT